MFLRRIAVRHWRGLDELVLEGLSPHLNLISGPNESGKSRLVQALHFALFESSKGRAGHKKDLATWGAGSARPEVEVEFELDGRGWTLQKVFLGSGHDTRLRGPDGTLEDEAAEVRLAQLLGVSAGGSREVRPEDLGIWPLLWVRQGGAWEVPTEQAGEGALGVLQDRLGSEIGEVAAGPVGQRVLALAESRAAEFFTPGKGQETGALRRLREALSDAEVALKQARERHDAVQADADALQRELARESDLGERVAAARRALNDTERQDREAADVRRELELCEERLQRALAETRAAAQRRDDAAALDVQLAEAVRRSETLARDLAGKQEALAAAETRLSAAQAELTEAEAAFDAARAAARAARQRARRAEAQARREALLRERAALVALDGERRKLRDGLAGLPELDAQGLAALRELRQRVERLGATLQGVATRIEIHARDAIDIDGETLSAGEAKTLLVDEDRRIDLGAASLQVRPGGGELARLRDELADAERAWRDRCAELGVEDLTAAEQQLRQRERLAADLERVQKDIRARWPDGLDALDAELEALDAAGPGGDTEKGGSEQVSDEAGQGDEAARPEAARPEAVGLALDDAEAALEAAEQIRDAARTRRDLALEQRGAIQPELAALTTERQGVAERIESLQHQRGALPAAPELEEALGAARNRVEADTAARDDAKNAFEALGGERLANALQQARQAVTGIEEQQKTCRDERVRLETRLADAGGTFEVLQAAETERQRLGADLARVERQAVAARRLAEVLRSAHDAAQQRLAAPVIEKIAPYLSDVFPGSSVWLDERLTLQGLRSTDADEQFDQLSGGAREQLALLVRLGLAEVLAGGGDAEGGRDGESWPLILDDVLVNTDPERIRRMQRALFDASRRVQILLFTCNGALFDGVGADWRIDLPPRRA